METGEKSVLQLPFEGPREPVFMQQITGTAKEPKKRMLYLTALDDGDDRQKFKDPFKARDSKTGDVVKLKKASERRTAYGLLKIQPPQDLVEGIRLQRIIRTHKSSKMVKRGIRNGR